MTRAGRPKAELVLSEDERAALLGWVRRRSTPPSWALRCRIVLECATDKDVAEKLGSTALHRRHRAEKFKKFLATLDKQTPADLDIHLVLDNYATHKAPAIRTWLVAHPRFHLHFTPTGSSWLNLVERWFAELTNKTLGPERVTVIAATDTD